MSETVTLDPASASGADSVQERLDRYWSGRAEAYHRRQVEGSRAEADREAWHAIWTAALPLPAGGAASRVLDVGTGSGYVASVLAELGHDVIGLDSSPGMLAEARRDADLRRTQGRPAARFAHGDAVDPAASIADAEPFDALTSRYLLWTLRDPAEALRAWSRLVRPGGTIACVDAAWYPGGIDRTVAVESTQGPDAFVAAYDARAERALPLAAAASVDDFAAVFADAGLEGVEVAELHAIAELDRRFGVSPGHEPRPQFLITARVPAQPA